MIDFSIHINAGAKTAEARSGFDDRKMASETSALNTNNLD
jgi:hypothetical protein